MVAPTSLHPTDQTLHAFSLGKLGAASAKAVRSHLHVCAECRQRVAEISSDTFLDRIREAQARTETPALADGSPGAFAPPPTSSLPPGLADHPDYEIVGELGRGGMGVVYLARNKLMGRNEVLKVVSRELMDRRGVLDRFLREIRNAAQLHHANIVTAYSAIRAGESIAFAMEYVEGYDLGQLVKGQGPLPVALACNFIYQVAQGLQYAHQKGMVHRDIKPSNLILAREGNKPVVKVLDFGLAKATREGPVEGGLTHEGQMLGTPDYIAPEQSLDAQKADIRADIYSLGCTLYYLLSGGPPFRGSSLYEVLQGHHSMEAKPLNLVRPEVPWEVAAVVGKMMAKVPARRYQTPGEVARALKPFFKTVEAGPVAPEPAISQARQPAAGERVARPRSKPAPPRAKLVPPTPEPAALKPLEATQADSSGLNLLEIVVAEPSTSDDTALAPRRVRSRPPWLWLAVAGGVLAFGLLIAWDAGVFKVKTNDVPSQPDGVGSAPRFDRSRFDVLAGQWQVEKNELVQKDLTRWYNSILFGDKQWTDYDFSVDAMRIGGGNSFSLLVRAGNRGDSYKYVIGGEGNTTFSVVADERGQTRSLESLDFRIQDHTWYTARVHVRGNHVACFLYDSGSGEDHRLFDVYDDRFARGRVGLETFISSFRFKNIKVTSPDGKVLWEGPPAVGLTTTAVPSRPASREPDGWVSLLNMIPGPSSSFAGSRSRS